VENQSRDDESDDRVRDWNSDGDEGCAHDDAPADVAVGAGMIAIGNQGRRTEASTRSPADDGGCLVAHDADDPGHQQRPQVCGGLRV
jgi:hypothetical protein